MNPEIKNTLKDVARRTGRPFCTIERVFRLMTEVHDNYGNIIGIEDGKPFIVIMPEGSEDMLPELLDEIGDAGDDIVELYRPIMNALSVFCPGSEQSLH